MVCMNTIEIPIKQGDSANTAIFVYFPLKLNVPEKKTSESFANLSRKYWNIVSVDHLNENSVTNSSTRQ